MFKTTGSGEVGGLTQFFDKKVGVGGIEEVDVARGAIENLEGEFFVERREDCSWFLVRVATWILFNVQMKVIMW